MRITYDKDADAAYVYFKDISPGEVDKTISLNDSVNIDFDKEGKTIGIEIINARDNLPLNTLKSATLL